MFMFTQYSFLMNQKEANDAGPLSNLSCQFLPLRFLIIGIDVQISAVHFTKPFATHPISLGETFA